MTSIDTQSPGAFTSIILRFPLLLIDLQALLVIDAFMHELHFGILTFSNLFYRNPRATITLILWNDRIANLRFHRISYPLSESASKIASSSLLFSSVFNSLMLDSALDC